MAITYPLQMPTGLKIRSLEWIPENSVSSTESPFSKKLKVYDNGGKRWRAAVGLPIMSISDAKRWQAFFLALNGLTGTFQMTPSLEGVPTGTALGTPLVNGASQTGQTLLVDGWTINQPLCLSAGDWIGLGGYLYRVLVDVSSDGSGESSIEIWPNLRSSPSDNQALTLTSPLGLFRMAEIPSMALGANRLVDGMQFGAVEAI